MSYEIYHHSISEFVKFKSVSTDDHFTDQMVKTVDWLVHYFTSNGFESHVWRHTEMNPVVFASHRVSEEAKTILIYGHYDVQPANQKDGWSSEPFNLAENSERLFARGIIDNKGQFFVHLATIVDLSKRGELKHNIKFLVEGNEETGNPKLGELIKTHKDALKSDVILISDGQLASENPTIEASFRGSFNMTLRFVTATNDLHSGDYGGGVPNASHELSRLISLIYDDDSRVLIPGFYDGVKEPSPSQLENNKALVLDISKTFAGTGIEKPHTEPNLDFFTQVGLRPTLQITGFRSGYIGEGFSNIVPGSAEAKINVRVVDGQDPLKIYEKIQAFVKANSPEYVRWTTTLVNPSSAIEIDTDSDDVRLVKGLLERVFGKRVLIKYVGGSLPVVSDFKQILKVNPISVPLANEDCNMHGVNENFEIDKIRKGLEFSRLFFGSKI